MSHADSNMLGQRRNVGVVPIDEPLTPAQVEQQAGFYRAIQADLDDDAPRLVYADWLDEQGGDGRALRAEFIRLQCAAPFRLLHGVTGPPSAASDRTREEAIFELCGEGWDKELNLELQPSADVYEPPWAPVWRRGFPEKMLFQSIPNRTHDPTANGLPFLRDAGVPFSNEELALVRARFDAGDFSNLRRLSLGCAAGTGGTPFSSLLTLPDLPHLTSLEIWSATITQTDMATILAAPLVSRLTELSVAACDFGDIELRMLAASTVLRRLRSLNLSRNDITDEGAIALSRSPHLKGLTRLNVSNNQLTERGLAALRESARLRRDCEIISLAPEPL